MESKHVMNKDDKIYVAGHTGFVGSAIYRKLKKDGYTNIITVSHSDLDLTDQAATRAFFEEEKPDYVFMAAAKAGGIQANFDALDEFMYVNNMIAFNTITSAFQTGVKKFCYLGSGCIYPRDCAQPMKEEYLLTGPLEITNEGYALSKISGVKYCEYINNRYRGRADFISPMPCNLYGPGDNYHPVQSHVIPALMRKFHEAKESGSKQVEMWGTGSALREFMHIDDVADACVFLMNNYSGDTGVDEKTPGISWINVGCGYEISMKELGRKIADVVGFEGDIVYDHVHPDGTPRKLLDSTRLLDLGWKPSISFEEGLKDTYEDYKKNKDNYRK